MEWNGQDRERSGTGTGTEMGRSAKETEMRTEKGTGTRNIMEWNAPDLEGSATGTVRNGNGSGSVRYENLNRYGTVRMGTGTGTLWNGMVRIE